MVELNLALVIVLAIKTTWLSHLSLTIVLSECLRLECQEILTFKVWPVAGVLIHAAYYKVQTGICRFGMLLVSEGNTDGILTVAIHPIHVV